MTKRKAKIIILCEDLQQQVFARYFLINQGVSKREIILRPLPSGKRAGEQYVRKKYPSEVKAYRSKSTYQMVRLVVLIDADSYSVNDRLRQLDDMLEESGFYKRQANEKIGIFVPKRNIETWLAYLRGEIVDENREDPYPKYKKCESDCKIDVEELAAQCDRGLEQTAPPSLQTACQEWQRLQPVVQ